MNLPVETPAPAAHRLPAATRLGATELVVTDLDRAADFYIRILGLREHDRQGLTAVLGNAAEPVLVLHADPAARPAGRHAGLYHVALLYPSRLELARAALRIASTRTPIQGASDHGTHEAIYLPDPDGNGVELAADRPREQWPPMSDVLSHGGPAPLDQAALFALVAGEEPSEAPVDGLATGHLHLHVGDVAEATRFYRDGIGFDLMMAIPSAAFLSAGGYHHHVAVNTWRGEGVGPAPSGSVGLRRFTVVLPEAGDIAAVADRLSAGGFESVRDGSNLTVRDPSGNALRLTWEDAA